MHNFSYWLQSLFGMNLSGPIWGPLIPDATANNSQTNTVAGSNGSLSLSNNQTDAIVGAISSSGSYLWSFKMYWVITAPVTLATILLPLVAGHIFRSITQFCYKNRISAFAIGFICLLASIIGVTRYERRLFYLLAMGIGAFALMAFVLTAWTGIHQWHSAFFSMVFVASFAIDLYVAPSFATTGVVPLIYLILRYVRVEIKHFLGPKLETRRLYMTKLLHPLRRHSWIWQASIVCAYYASAVSLSYWEWFSSLFVIGTPLGLLGLNRIIYSFANPRAEHKIYWTFYIFVYISSMLLGYYKSALCLALVPMTYLFAFWLYLHHWRGIRDQLWRLIRDRPSDRDGLAA